MKGILRESVETMRKPRKRRKGKTKNKKKSGRVVKFKEECVENFNKVYIIYSILSKKFKNEINA